jgi:restriction system protein
MKNKPMPTPDYQSIILPLLKYASDKKEHSIRETIEYLANVLMILELQKYRVMILRRLIQIILRKNR